MLRLLRLDDDSGLRLLNRHDGLLLLRRVHGPFVAGHAERDETAWPDSADEQDPGDTKRDDPNEFLPMRPGMRRLLDHDGGRLHHLRLRLVDDLAHGLLLLVHDLSHGLQPGLHDRHGRGLHDHGSLRLHDGAHHGSLGLGSGPRLILAVGLGARDVARGDFLLALHGASWLFSQAGLYRNLSAGRHLGCPSKREAVKRDAMCGSDALGAPRRHASADGAMRNAIYA